MKPALENLEIPSRLRRATGLLLALALILALTSVALGQAGQSNSAATTAYGLDWWTVDGGGGSSSGGGYRLGGTTGQPDAGALAGTGYNLSGGFWVAGAVQYRIYLPLTLRGYL